MWVKICANTSLEDARLAVEYGADAVGFVFAPSKRLVTPSQVAAITSDLPAEIERIGVFHAIDADETAAAIQTAGLTGAQLHREFDPKLVDALHARLGAGRASILQTVHWNVALTADEQHAHFLDQLAAIQRHGGVDAVLVDSKTASESGGTGVRFDWKAAAAMLHDTGMKIIVAGGLNPLNVADAITTMHPWGVDVASGSEASPGKKDPAKVREFIRNAKQAQGTPAPVSSDASRAY